MSIISYIQIYAAYCCSVLLFFLPGIITYKNFALIIAIVSSIAIFYIIAKNKFIISRTFGISFLILACCALAYKYITPIFYGYSLGGERDSEFLVFVGQLMPGLLTAVLVGENRSIQKKIINESIGIALIFGLVALVCTLNPSTSTSGGLAMNDNNLNYQSLSYLAAYSAALCEVFLLINGNIINKSLSFATYGMIVLDLLTILIAGGRGGLVAYILFGIIFLVLTVRSKQITTQQVIKFILEIILVILGGLYIVRIASNSTVSTSGFNRLLGFLNGAGDVGRAGIWNKAISSFINSPFVGHGIGSVFYEVGQYSHNIFLDLLVETGLLGTLLFVFFIIYYLRTLFRMMRCDICNSFWLFIFLCGFFMNLFSGYYLISIPMWWSIFAVISKKRFEE